MTRTTAAMMQYLACVAMGLCIFAFVINPVVSATVDAMNDAANTIAERPY